MHQAIVRTSPWMEVSSKKTRLVQVRDNMVMKKKMAKKQRVHIWDNLGDDARHKGWTRWGSEPREANDTRLRMRRVSSG